MTEQDDFIPPWVTSPAPEVTPGTYVWPVTVESAKFQDQEREKPYLKIELRVIVGGDQFYSNYLFPFRLYITKAARGWVQYFLKKFGYPTELLEGPQPVLRASAIIGLVGKVMVEVTDSEYGLKFDVRGFSRLAETELEAKLTPKQEVALEPSEPTVDLEADVKKEPDLSWLDEK